MTRNTKGATPTPYRQVVEAILTAGGRPLGTASGAGVVTVEKFVLPGGVPVFVEMLRDGGVELYAPPANTDLLSDLFDWIKRPRS